MIPPFTYMETRTIKGNGITICKVETTFKFTSSQLERGKRIGSKNKREYLENSFLTDYLVFRKTSSKPIGWLSLKGPLGKFGEATLRYKFSEILSEQQGIEIFKTFLTHVQKFYGSGFNADQKNASASIFQEVRVVLMSQKKDLVFLLKAGFKISWEKAGTLILRHRYLDQTGVSYEEVKDLELKKKDFYSTLNRHRFLKLEEAVLKGDPLQGEDLEVLKWYLKDKAEALSYYLFLIGNNFKLYLDYARVMTTLESILRLSRPFV